MNTLKTQIKEFIRKDINEAFATWIISKRDMQEILISIALDLVQEEHEKQEGILVEKDIEDFEKLLKGKE